MKILHRLVVLCLATVLCLPIQVFAYTPVNYNAIMSSAFAKYFIACQPDSAIVLNNTTMISNAEASPNYTKGVFDLPRLSTDYYYDIPTDAESWAGNGAVITQYGIGIGNTTYPTLAVTGAAIPTGTTFTLCIRSVETDAAVATFNVTTNGEIDYLDTMFKDCSAGLLETLLDADAKLYGSITTSEGPLTSSGTTSSITIYPAALHKVAVVMPNYIIGDKDDTTVQSFVGSDSPVKTFSWTNIDTQYTGYDDSRNTQNDMHFKAGNDNKTNGAGLALFTTGSCVAYNNGKGVATTTGNAIATSKVYQGKYKGVYMVCLEKSANTYGVLNQKLDMSGETNVLDSAPKIVLQGGTPTDILSQLTGVTKTSKYDVEFSTGTSDLSIDADYKVTYLGRDDAKINLNATASAYGGYTLHLATLDCKGAADKYFVNLWYTDPVTGEDVKVSTVSANVGSIASITDTPNDTWTDFDFQEWCTDKTCTTTLVPANAFKNATANQQIDVWAKFKYVGGTYKVQFYNDATSTSSNGEFECRNQPTLPNVPTRSGYLFKNWMIVDTIASTDGTAYSPETFVPVKDKSYIFKTFWDVEGVIQSVSTTKTEYWVGDKIDKSKVVVKLLENNTGTIRNLSTSEFTVSPTTVSAVGKNQIQVTYTKTGATATFEVTGKAVEPKSIRASYSGGPVTVGESVNAANVKVTLTYSNGTTKTLSSGDYSLSPTTIANAGSNTVTVSYQGLTTTFSVTGQKKETATTVPGKAELVSISATYTGQVPFVGDAIKASDIKVTANYKDGKQEVISSTSFTYTPSYVKVSGSNVVTVTYGGKSTTVTITGKEKADVTGNVKGTTGGTTDTGTGLSGTSGVGASTTASGSSTSTGGETGTTSNKSTTSKDGKGTSKSYLNGANVLTMDSLQKGTTVVNDTDIMSVISSTGTTSKGIDIDLINQAAGNEITSEMLEALKKKNLNMRVRMLDSSDGSTVAVWEIDGGSLDSTNYTINPNITIETISKGSETLYYMSIVNVSYPENIELTLYPALGTYESGAVVRLYKCSMFRDNAYLLNTVRWSDVSNPVLVNIYESTAWCLSDAASAYDEGASLEKDNTPSEVDAEVDDADTESIGSEDEYEEETETFNFDDEEAFSFDAEAEQPQTLTKSKSKLPVILMIGGAVLLIGGGAVGFVMMNGAKLKGGKSEFDEDEDFEDEEFEDDEIGSELDEDDSNADNIFDAEDDDYPDDSE